jgi:V/A-type H+-transporting ATPase subunit C
MSAAADVADALAAIRDTDVGGYLEEKQIDSFDDVDRYLWEHFTQRIDDVEAFRFLPGDILKISRAYVTKYDVLNIKSVLRGLSAGRKARVVPAGVIYNSGLLDKLTAAESTGDIIQLLVDSELGNFVHILEEYNVEGDAKAKFIAESKLDSEYFKNTLHVTQRVKDGAVFAKALGVCIDLANLQIVVRAIVDGLGSSVMEHVIEGGYLLTEEELKGLVVLRLNDLPQRVENAQYQSAVEELSATYDGNRNIAVMEEVFGRHRFKLLKDMLSPRILSPLVMAWYLITKEAEMRNLRLILKAKFDGFPVEEISGYLVL